MTREGAFKVLYDGRYSGLTRIHRISLDAETVRRSRVGIEMIALRVFREMRKDGVQREYLAVREAVRSIYQAEKKARKR